MGLKSLHRHPAWKSIHSAAFHLQHCCLSYTLRGDHRNRRSPGCMSRPPPRALFWPILSSRVAPAGLWVDTGVGEQLGVGCGQRAALPRRLPAGGLTPRGEQTPKLRANPPAVQEVRLAATLGLTSQPGAGGEPCPLPFTATEFFEESITVYTYLPIF